MILRLAPGCVEYGGHYYDYHYHLYLSIYLFHLYHYYHYCDLHQGVLSTGDSPRLMTAKMINHKIEEVTREASTAMIMKTMTMTMMTMNFFQVMDIKMPAKTELMYGNTQRFQRQTSQVGICDKDY